MEIQLITTQLTVAAIKGTGDNQLKVTKLTAVQVISAQLKPTQQLTAVLMMAAQLVNTAKETAKHQTAT